MRRVPMREFRHLARALVPIAIVFELIDQERLVAAGEKQQGKGQIANAPANLQLFASLALIAWHLAISLGEDADAFVKPIVAAKIFVTAGQPRALDAIKPIEEIAAIAVGVFARAEFFTEPVDAALHALVGDVSLS